MNILRLFRLVVVICQGISILVTWNLWQVRTMPPLLPALPLPAFDMAVILLLSLVLVLIRPRSGLIAHTALLIYAMLTDQTRLQPEFVSLAFLMWGTLPRHSQDASKPPAPDANAQTIARFHLVALWTWAGINKLLSPVFLTSTGPQLAGVLLGFLPMSVLRYSGYAIALAELALGILTLIPRTRKAAAVLALVLHGGILLTLLTMHYNSAVWAWNAALALAGFALVWDWRENPLKTLKLRGWWVRAAAAVLLITPAGFYIGAFDAYLSHNLYSSNTARAEAPVSTQITWTQLNVPLPPEHRLFEQFFQATCRRAQVMLIRDTRPYFEVMGWGQRTIRCAPTE
ncbi:MAG: hypothetical protein SF162_16215 [bacterium]|nr:hypothetical protein [bacterium]